MREYNCGGVLDIKMHGKFIVREYDYCENKLIFCNYDTKEEVTIKESDNLQELKELGFELFEKAISIKAVTWKI